VEAGRLLADDGAAVERVALDPYGVTVLRLDV